MASTSATAVGIATASPDRAWSIATPLTPVGFYPKFGPLPAVVAVHDQTGDWDAPGQTRRLILSDGGSVIEHLELVNAPQRFEYRLSDFQKLFGHLVSGARAEWRFTPVPGGTSIRWTYTFDPYPRTTVLVALIVRVFWAPYMRRVLPGIIAEVDRRA